MTIAILIAVSGVFAFALLAEQPTGIRVGILIGSLVVGVVLGWFSAPGKEFAKYCKASYEELRRVVWPTKGNDQYHRYCLCLRGRDCLLPFHR